MITSPQPRRRSSGPTSTSSEPLLPLQAQIWGLPGTGKRTLLQRLQGKDPFATTTSCYTTTSHAGTSRSSSSSSLFVPTVVVPYQVPRGLLAWDRIQLRVSLVEEEEDRNDTTPQKQHQRDESGVAAAAAQQRIDFVVLHDMTALDMTAFDAL